MSNIEKSNNLNHEKQSDDVTSDFIDLSFDAKNAIKNEQQFNPQNIDLTNYDDRQALIDMVNNKGKQERKFSPMPGVSSYDKDKIIDSTARLVEETPVVESEEKNNDKIQLPAVRLRTSIERSENLDENNEALSEENEQIQEQNENNSEEIDENREEVQNFSEIRQQWQERINQNNAPRNIFSRAISYIWKNNFTKAFAGAGFIAFATTTTVATGGAGLIALPIAYGLGVKICLEGVIGLVQNNLLGGRRLENNVKNIENNIEQKLRIYESYENSDMDSRDAMLRNMENEITKLNIEHQVEQEKYKKWDSKQTMIRSTISTVGSIGAGIGFGVPLGTQNFDGNAVSHAVRWSFRGFEFIYNGSSEMLQATQFAAKYGYNLTMTSSYGHALGSVPLGGLLSMIGTGGFMAAGSLWKIAQYKAIKKTEQPTAYQMQQQLAEATTVKENENNNILTTPPANPRDPIRTISRGPAPANHNRAGEKNQSQPIVKRPESTTPESTPNPRKEVSEDEVKLSNKEKEVVGKIVAPTDTVSPYPDLDTTFPEIVQQMQNIINNRHSLPKIRKDKNGNPVEKDNRMLDTIALVFGAIPKEQTDFSQLQGIQSLIEKRCLKEIDKFKKTGQVFDTDEYFEDWQIMFEKVGRPDLYFRLIENIQKSDNEVIKSVVSRSAFEDSNRETNKPKSSKKSTPATLTQEEKFKLRTNINPIQKKRMDERIKKWKITGEINVNEFVRDIITFRFMGPANHQQEYVEHQKNKLIEKAELGKFIDKNAEKKYLDKLSLAFINLGIIEDFFPWEVKFSKELKKYKADNNIETKDGVFECQFDEINLFVEKLDTQKELSDNQSQFAVFLENKERILGEYISNRRDFTDLDEAVLYLTEIRSAYNHLGIELSAEQEKRYINMIQIK